jgi:hypothetical protein
MMHYARAAKYGDPTKTMRKQLHGATLQERFDHYVDKSGECWVWIGTRDNNGYGRLNVAGTPVLAHRVSWQLHKHEITSDQHVLHKCDNPPCCNPEHLFLGDQAANNADMVAKGRFHPGVSLGSAHGMAKLTETQVLEIRDSTGPSRLTAERYGISDRHVRDIRNRQIWKHLN